MKSEDEDDWLERAIEAADPCVATPSSRLDNYDPARAGRPWNWKPEGKARFTRAMLKAAILILTTTMLFASLVRWARAGDAPPPSTRLWIYERSNRP